MNIKANNDAGSLLVTLFGKHQEMLIAKHRLFDRLEERIPIPR